MSGLHVQQLPLKVSGERRGERVIINLLQPHGENKGKIKNVIPYQKICIDILAILTNEFRPKPGVLLDATQTAVTSAAWDNISNFLLTCKT